MVEDILYARLSGDATLTALVPGGIYPTNPSDNTAIPYLSYGVETGGPGNYTSGPSSLTNYSVTITAWAKDEAPLHAILGRVKTLLHGWRGGNVQYCNWTGHSYQKTPTCFEGTHTYSLWVNEANVQSLADGTRSRRRKLCDKFSTRSNCTSYPKPDLKLSPVWTSTGLFIVVVTMGVPWHADDLNARLKRNGAYALYRRAVGPDLEPVWPEKWPRERLALRKAEVGAASFARGYRLVPLAAEETPIRPAWVRFWTEPAAYECVLLSVDPAVTASAKADASALVVLAKTGPEKSEIRSTKSESGQPGPGLRSNFEFRASNLSEIHVLDAVARRVSAPELVGLIDDLDRRWTPDVILFESNAAFAGIRDLLVRHARFGPRVKGVTQSRDKAARAAALSVPVENGSVRLKGDGAGGVDAGQRPLFEEMTTFPFAEHDDLLDALGTGVAHLLDRREPRVW